MSSIVVTASEFYHLITYGFSATPNIVLSPNRANPQGSPSPLSNGFSPQQIVSAYGFPSFSAGSDGAGQTIAIIGAFHDPSIVSDANTFSKQYSLPQFGSAAGPTITVVGPQGVAASTGGWDVEASLDVEWAHAIAPKANILLVEAKDNSYDNLMAAVDWSVGKANSLNTAPSNPTPANVVSMSWGGPEFLAETSYDSHFKVNGVTFIAASGDKAGIVQYPSASPWVLSVGGTTITIKTNGTTYSYGSETAWSGTSGQSGGGGGLSAYELIPGYQNQLPAGSFSVKNYRATPDLSFVANPSTGVNIYDSQSGWSGWGIVGGTSLGTPAIAGAVAIANQKRIALKKPSLTTNSLTSSFAYSAAGSATYYTNNYHDITSGLDASYKAQTGYDLTNGLGSPNTGWISYLVDNIA